MKFGRKDVLLVVMALVMVGIIGAAVVITTQSGSAATTTTWTVDFGDVPSPFSSGNVTTWTFADGAWSETSVTNGNRSVWMFANVSSGFSCRLSGASPIAVTIDFGGMPSPFNVGNNTLWTRSGSDWWVSSSSNYGHSMWTLQNMSPQAKCFSGQTVTSTITIDFIDSASPNNPGNLTTWTMINGVWTKTSVPNDGHSVWVFRNLTSKPSCFAQLQAAESIGGFGDTNSTYSAIGGVLIVSLAGLENQNNGGPGWQYYVNGIYAQRSCSLYYMSNGDQVVWMYKPLVS
jgi:hypothetical protein